MLTLSTTWMCEEMSSDHKCGLSKLQNANLDENINVYCYNFNKKHQYFCKLVITHTSLRIGVCLEKR